MNQEPKLPKPLFFKKIRPKYKKALILALIISFIIAVILLLFFNRYFFKPALENRGSVKNKPAVIVTKQERRLRFKV
jgi:hypothetical protein